MKLVVFGGSGFLGSHIADALTEEGYEVTIFDKKKSLYIKKNQKMVIGDILDEKLVRKVISKMDIVYNFAGIADIDESVKSPLETVKNNILGNTMILEGARLSKIKRFVFASSIYVYSDSGSFYRTSKQACELLIENYKKIYGLNFTILRFGSLYGPRANETNWIHKIIKQAIEKKEIIRKGNGEELREYIHVQDAAKLSVEILGKGYMNQYVIITGNQKIKVKDLLVMIKEMMKGKIKIKYHTADYNEHYIITPYVFNPKPAKRIIGKNYIDLGQGIYSMLNDTYYHNEKKC